MRSMRWFAVLAVVLSLGGLGGFARGAAQTPVVGLTWEPCPPAVAGSATPAAAADAGLECATLHVPLDYADPAGEQIAVGLNRLPARNPDARIGSLIFNPGGPGDAGSTYVAREAAGTPVFSPEVRDRFDLIGMDPRGTGTSALVRCDPDVWNEYVPRFPTDEVGFERLRAHTQAVWGSCLRLTGPLLGHLDAVSVAHDIERVRLALGGEPLNWLGLSYGSLLGATYAQLYPENIRAMVLDGALDHSVSPLTMLDNEARAHEKALERFAAWCAATETCALHGQDVMAVFDELVAAADETPLPAPRCAESGACRAEATGEDIRVGMQGLLLIKHPVAALGHPGWEGAARALAAARDGDASAFAPALAQSETDGIYAGLAIACTDWETNIETHDDIAALETFARVIAPRSQGATQTWGNLTGCMNLPVPVANPTGPWNVADAPPLLIVNAAYDPSTAYVWAQGMRERIAGGVLLTRLGDGHTSYYLAPGESQTRDAIDRYLLTGETPPPNTVYES